MFGGAKISNPKRPKKMKEDVQDKSERKFLFLLILQSFAGIAGRSRSVLKILKVDILSRGEDSQELYRENQHKSTEDAKSERGHQRRAKLNTAAYALRECEWQSTLYSSYELRRNGAPGVEERLSAGGQRAPGAAVAGRRAKPAGLAP